jgi:hypothetical protein
MWKEVAQPEPDFAIVRVPGQRLNIIQSPRPNRASLQDELHRLFPVEFYAGLLHFAVRQEPDKRFVVKIDNLDAIAPWIVKVAAERRYQFDFVFPGEFLSNFLKLRVVANHDSEMPHVCALHLVHFENREELVFAQFEEGVALAATHLFEIENILVKGHRFLNVIHLDRDMIASINSHAHMSA